MAALQLQPQQSRGLGKMMQCKHCRQHHTQPHWSPPAGHPAPQLPHVLPLAATELAPALLGWHRRRRQVAAEGWTGLAALLLFLLQ
jgi:hypothetical protein